MSDQAGPAPTSAGEVHTQAWINGVIDIHPDFGGGEHEQDMPDTVENRALCKRINREWVQQVTPIA